MASASLSPPSNRPYVTKMNGEQIANMAYLGLLAAVITGSYLISQRGNMGKVAQQASIWALIFIGVIAVAGMWGDITQSISPRQQMDGAQVTVPRSPDGHYYLTLDINNTPVNFVVDTGASQVVLTQEDARRVGLNPSELRYLGSANTANGVVQTAAVSLDEVSLGEISDRQLRAVVNGGQMDTSLLGMTYLNGFSSIAITNNELVLTR